MSAIFDRVLTVNLIANTAIFYVAARLYLLPLVPRVRPQQILVPILLLHSTRHLGLMFLTRGATFPGMPPQFAYPAAFGDLLTAILAFAAIPFVLRGSGLAKPEPRNTNGIAANASMAENRSPNAAGYANCGGIPGKVAPRVRNISPRCRIECKRRMGTRICCGRTRGTKGSK